MNTTRVRIISILNKLKFIFFLVLYIVGEIIDSYYPNLVYSIIEDTRSIDPFNMTNITGYVYFSLTGAKYPTDYDEYLNLSAFGAIIRRKVDYCQFEKNGLISFLKSFFSNTRQTYWAESVDDLSTLVNPPLTISVNETYKINNMTIGNLTVLSSFYTNDLSFYYLGLDQEGLNNFSYSNASSDFEYIKKGYFYHSVTNQSTNIKLEKIQNQLLQEKEEYEDILYESQQKLFEKCNAGDVRIRYNLYAPINVTYFGYVENYTLKPVYVDDIRFGATARGSNKSLMMLVKAFTPNGIYSEQDTLEDLFAFSYLHVVKMKIAFDTWRFISHIFRNDPLRTTYWLITVGVANLTFRSLICNFWVLGIKFWGTSLFAMLVLGLVLGIWKIQFNQANNQIVDVHIHFDRDAIANMQQIINNMGNAQIRVRINRAGLNNNPIININQVNQNDNLNVHINPNFNNLNTNNPNVNNLNTNNPNVNNLNANNPNVNNLNTNNPNINNLNTNNNPQNNQNVNNNQNIID